MIDVWNLEEGVVGDGGIELPEFSCEGHEHACVFRLAMKSQEDRFEGIGGEKVECGGVVGREHGVLFECVLEAL